jgi:hypothetical protein
MGRVKTSVVGDDPVAITGLNGCPGVFFFGTNFVTAAHIEPDAIASQTTAGASQAQSKGTVTAITIKAVDASDFTAVRNAIGNRFPNARIVDETYDMTDDTESFTTFTASPGSTTVESKPEDHLGSG